MKQQLLTILLFCSIVSVGQYTTPTIDGILDNNEYGVHIDGQNRQSNWFVTWDATNLYISLIFTSVSDAAVFYIDRNPISPINGGANTNGTLVGVNYDGTNFSNLPFRADFVTYFKNGTREYRTANGSNGWSTATTNFGAYSDNSQPSLGFVGDVRELSIPWSAIGGFPTSFNFFGYTTSSAGAAANQVPSGNPTGSFGTTATANYYQTVSNTADAAATLPFSRTSYATNATSSISSAQSLWDLTVNGTSITTTLSAMQSVSGAVAVASGNTLASGGNLTLVSTATGTARIATISNALGSITGNVTCQLYIPSGNRRFRFLSHPFSANSAINILGNSVSYTGSNGTTNGFTHNTLTNNPSVFTWNTASANGGTPTDAGWSSITSATSTSAWPRRRGIRILIRGAFNEGLDGLPYTPSAVTLSMTGTLATTSGSSNLNVQTGGTGATQNFAFLGNPFAAPFNIGQAVMVDANNFNSANNIRRLTNNIYVRIPSTGLYTTVDLSLNPNYTIPAYCGFFGVVTNGNTQLANDFSFNIANIASTASAGTNVFRELTTNQKYFELQTLLNGEVYDNTIVKFDSTYKASFNLNQDAGKPTNDFINNYTISSDNIRLANNTTPFVDGATIPLGITQNSGKRSLQFKVSSYHLADTQQVILLDKFLNTRTKLAKDVLYNFEIDNSDTASVGEKRFVLEMHTAKTQPSTGTTTSNIFNAKIVGSNIISNNNLQVQITNPAKAATSVRLVNFSGQQLTVVQGGKSEQQTIAISSNSLQAGKYFIEVICGAEKQLLSVIKY